MMDDDANDMFGGFGLGMGEGIHVCDDCSVSHATVHLTHVEQDGTHTFHLCEDCARKRGVPLPDGETLKGLEAMAGGAPFGETHVKVTVKPIKLMADYAAEPEPEPDAKCPNCGMLLSEFRSRGRLGCASCYGCFEGQIGRILVQIHGPGGHKGKAYGKAPPRKAGKRELERLRRELDDAISGERFEQAALIRDAIRGLKDLKPQVAG